MTAVSAPTAEESGEKGEESADVEAPAVVEEAAPAPRTRRRATRRVSTPAAEAVTEAAAPEAPAPVEEAPAKVAEPEVEAKPETEAVAEDASPRRGRRRVARKAAVGFSAPAPAVQNGDTEGGRRPARPAVAVFQAPVFAEPMFQTPERAAAAAAAEAAEDVVETEEEAVEAAPVAETVVEEQTPRRRRRRRGGDEEPVAAAPVVAAEPEETEAVEDAYESAEDGADVDDDGEDEGPGSRRRRRRGGRRRRRGESADSDLDSGDDDYAGEQAARSAEGTSDAVDTADQVDEDAEEDERDEPGGSGSASSRRRRRRRRRAGDSSGESEPVLGDSDPERTIVKVREPRAKREEHPSDEVQSIKGSTRLEAKKQRRREGREQGRRRVPIITEAEFLARREAVERVMVVRQYGDRTQIGVLEDNVLVEHYVNKEQATSYVGNVYLGKVQNVLPSMEAAFIDIGKGRNAVLYAGEVNFEALGMAHGPRRIESALKSGQPVLVQVTKDPIGHKGARLTSQVSLPGRYLVYVPEGSMTGISRKLPDTERARLKTILKKIVPEDAGVIVRTAAEGASEDELRRDVERLQAQWEDIEKKSKSGGSSNAPTLLYGEPDMTVRVVRDIFNEDFTKVIVSGDEAWQTIHGYVSHVAPDLVDRLSKWTSEVDVFATYRIDEQLAKALDRKVWLPSGGSLVIDKTEAMIVVDVNTGKFTGQGGNLEETVTRNNLEAAEEIVRQLRLRDLGGIVVIDFIDMVLESNRDLVLRRLLECLGRDRTKHQVAEVTSLGLVQMTRKRVGQGLLESFSETCVHCNGRGVIVHMEQPTASGGGGRRKKRGRGTELEHAHEHDVILDGAEEEPEAVEETETETEAEVAAEVAAPVALSAPVFEPDEELYNSAAEAEAAAGRGGRSRRRASRRASAPAGAPRAEARGAYGRGAETRTAESVVAEVPVVPEAVAHAEPVAVEDPVVEAPVVETPVAEAPVAEVPVAVQDDAAPKGRTRRRATRKVSAPAGSPKAADEAVAETVVTVVAEPVAEPEAAPAPVEAPVATESAAPARPRRRAVRKATAPTSSAEAAVMVVPSATEAPAPAEEAAAEEVVTEDTAPAKKTARKTAVKKATTAKKAPAKKTAAVKKTAAKKTTTAAKKTTAKKASPASKKTTAAAEQSPSSVSAVLED
ncbi:Rne/Rng family ribonuclease [Streptomyces sp. NRRL WC-3618]|uniref:Rne/Rng family ribonuclease n=1 Tax=Streptomyces sp. NRRL WC-3618 TaxID=1519490 RepID=UPI001F2189CC|nr:Rne/Rng family ribonuclease [Streptomyces sp. NRRL WC-3618]